MAAEVHKGTIVIEACDGSVTFTNQSDRLGVISSFSIEAGIAGSFRAEIPGVTFAFDTLTPEPRVSNKAVQGKDRGDEAKGKADAEAKGSEKPDKPPRVGQKAGK